MEQSYSFNKYGIEVGHADCLSDDERDGKVLVPETQSELYLSDYSNLDDSLVELEKQYIYTSTPRSDRKRITSRQDIYSQQSESGIDINFPKNRVRFPYISSQSDTEDDLLPLRTSRARKRSSKLNRVPRDFKMSVSRDSSETDCDSPPRHKMQPILKSSAYTRDIEHGGAKPKSHIHTKAYNDTDVGSSHYREQRQDTNRQSRTRNEMRHEYTYHKPTPNVEKEFESESMYIKPNCPAFRNIKGHYERPSTANAHSIHHSFENHVNYRNPKVENTFPDQNFDIIPPPMSRRPHVRQEPVYDDFVGHNYVERSPLVDRHTPEEFNRTRKEADTFNGETTYWVDYVIHFEQVAAWNRWNEREKAQQLTMCLRGTTQKILSDLTISQLSDYNSLKAILAQRFNPRENEIAFRCEFRNRKRLKDESAADYGYSL